jgi:uncharacterized protein (UPF0276 family)
MDAARVGIGLRAPHYAGMLERRPDLAFLEVHSENFFGDGGEALAWLERFRAAYPVSLHGVGLSLGSADPLDARHLTRIEDLARRFEPLFVSEHLCWSSAEGLHANDLLPLPYSEEALAHVVARIGAVQDRLGRALLVENVSTYVELPESAMPEWVFVAEAVRRSGCRLLLDVNNVWVNASNHGFDPAEYLEALDPGSVAEIHLAGFEREAGLLVDTHGAPVAAEVWALYARALERFGPRPTLIEWDNALPELDVLLSEAARARSLALAA